MATAKNRLHACVVDCEEIAAKRFGGRGRGERGWINRRHETVIVRNRDSQTIAIVETRQASRARKKTCLDDAVRKQWFAVSAAQIEYMGGIEPFSLFQISSDPTESSRRFRA